MTTRLIIGDCREKLRELPDASVHCVVTSPPYWGLRDYGVAGQIGIEPTMALHIQTLVEVFREVRRIMRDDATLWLNYGDCYSAQPGQRKTTDKVGAKQESNAGSVSTGSRCEPTLKPKDLCMVANRLAIALQDDGWWVRSEIIWHKPNPMPESVTDRPTSAHEKLWLLAKSARYYYDAEAVKEPMSDVSLQRLSQPNVFDQPGGPKDSGEGNRSHRRAINNQAERLIRHEKWKTRFEGWDQYDKSLGRNLRNVWTVATAPFPEAHFATFPPALVEPCIKAACPEGGIVLDPFAGSGTVGLVADRLGRNAILIELNADYTNMARARITDDAPLFAEIGD